MSIAQLDINIDQNWEPVIQRHRYLHNLIVNNSETIKGKWIDGNKGLRYDFGAGNSLCFFYLINPNPKSCSHMNGNQVEKHLPWVEQLKKDLSDLKFGSLTLQRSLEGLGEHIDGQESPVHCKLNFIITSTDANTYVKDGDQIKSYPSIANTAWLLDTTKPHWVTGNEERFSFQIGFTQSFEEVKEWFNNHPGLTYKQ